MNDLKGLQIDGDGLVGAGKDGDEKAAVGSGLGGIGVIGDFDPVGDFVGGRVDHGDAGSILIVGKNVSAIGRDGDALHLLGDGDGGDELAIGDIDDTDGARVDVGGVGAAAVFAEREHMGLGLASRSFGNDFAGCGVNDIDGVGQFGADVEHAVGTEVGLMWAQGLAEVDGGGELALLDVDDVDCCAVSAGLTDPGVAVDGNVGETGIRGDGDFVAVDADGDFGELAARSRIDEDDGVLFLVGNDKDVAGGQCGLASFGQEEGQ